MGFGEVFGQTPHLIPQTSYLIPHTTYPIPISTEILSGLKSDNRNPTSFLPD